MMTNNVAWLFFCSLLWFIMKKRSSPCCFGQQFKSRMNTCISSGQYQYLFSLKLYNSPNRLCWNISATKFLSQFVHLSWAVMDQSLTATALEVALCWPLTYQHCVKDTNLSQGKKGQSFLGRTIIGKSLLIAEASLGSVWIYCLVLRVLVMTCEPTHLHFRFKELFSSGVAQ